MSTISTSLYNPFKTQTNGIVSGQELAQVTSEISFAASQVGGASVASSNASLNLSKLKKVDMGLDLLNADSTTARQVAANKSAFDVQISSNALSSILMLQTEAAKAQASSNIVIPIFNTEKEISLSAIADEKPESNKKDSFILFA